MEKDYAKISTDWEADKSVMTVMDDILMFLDNFVSIYDDCYIYVYPHSLVKTIMTDGPVFLFKFLIHFETVAKDFYDAIAYYDTDPSKAGNYLGNMFKQFLLPYNPNLFSVEPGVGFNIYEFNPLNFTEGLITGLQANETPSPCLKQF